MTDETKPKGPAANLTAPRFKPGQSGNPGGKPAGTRNRLSGSFINALAEDFERYGRYAIARTRRKEPAAYVRALVALQPKQIEHAAPLDDLTDAELVAFIGYLRNRLSSDAGAGTETPPDHSQAH